MENLTVDPRFLEKSGISVVQTERGGNITYHGPGQLVAYPIVDLTRAGIKVVDWVSGLESVMMGIAGDFGITQIGPYPGFTRHRLCERQSESQGIATVHQSVASR